MKIAKDKVVQMHYTLTTDKGEVIDSSEGKGPLGFIFGSGMIIPGLEKQLAGKAAGDELKAIVTPEEGYGKFREELVQVVPKNGFQGDEDMAEGMQVQVETNNGNSVATITKIEGEEVTLDLNHPLADMTLHFEIEVVEVRDADAEELDHGHVHGPGGHEH